QGFHPDWKSFIFNYGRSEVQSFLVSSAMFWCDAYHADGLRMDAVASMLYLDYSRQGGEWVPNQYGGRENLEALQFIREMNQALYREFPDIQTAAEESTDWPMVSRPLYVGGLGFGMKWNMGWMHDTLDYFQKDPVHRKFHQNQLTFSIWYAFSENFMLPLSHDEVVYGKGSILGKMPGDGWQKFANLRLLYGYMWTHPGKKLLFMGDEFGQGPEWSHEGSLNWDQLEHENHQGIMRFVEDLNRLYREETALFELDFHPDGFQWLDFRDSEASVMSYLRLDGLGREVLVILNFTPVPRSNYRIGVPRAGVWREILNSDAQLYGGSGWGNLGALETAPVPSHGHYDSLSLVLPPLSALVFRPEDRTPRERGGEVSKEAEFLYASIREGGDADGEGS
ncbi:MAG: 1,4-alpha-glucan branching enzyme, partial [Thermodesulfobacteriota bacterium]|nr:1,4-alpha-glucan branching enzyme [Thermodesulfobacteriota bacterium]